jgi:hypothetical protein
MLVVFLNFTTVDVLPDAMAEIVDDRQYAENSNL